MTSSVVLNKSGQLPKQEFRESGGAEQKRQQTKALYEENEASLETILKISIVSLGWSPRVGNCAQKGLELQ